MEVLKHFFEYLVDKDRRMSSKAAMLIVAVLTVMLINNVTGFTYYYNSRSKIEQVKALNEIVLNDSTPEDIKIKAKALELEILERKTTPDVALDYTSKYYKDLQLSLAAHNVKPDVKPVVNVNKPQGIPVVLLTLLEPRNNFLFLMASCGVFVFLAMLMIPFAISIGFDQGWGTALAALVGIYILLILVGAVFYFTLGLIPRIGETWTWNYLISFLVQMAIITFTVTSLAANSQTKEAV